MICESVGLRVICCATDGAGVSWFERGAEGGGFIAGGGGSPVVGDLCGGEFCTCFWQCVVVQVFDCGFSIDLAKSEVLFVGVQGCDLLFYSFELSEGCDGAGEGELFGIFCDELGRGIVGGGFLQLVFELLQGEGVGLDGRVEMGETF